MSKSAGRYYLRADVFDLCWDIHIFPYKEFQMWGFDEDWYDGPIYEFGLGPLIYVHAYDPAYTRPEKYKR